MWKVGWNGYLGLIILCVFLFVCGWFNFIDEWRKDFFLFGYFVLIC